MFLRRTSLLGAGLTVLPTATLGERGEAKEQDNDVSTNEDLMHEHGILKRVLLICDEVIRRIDARQELPQTVIDSANRLFLE